MLLLKIDSIYGPMDANEGEQDNSQFMALPPRRPTLLTELSSRFSNIDKKFEYLNQKNITEKIV